MPIQRYFLSDFVSIQRQSFLKLLETGLIEEFSRRNPITSEKSDLELFFYPEYYILTRPEYNPQEAISKNKSYTSKLFVPAQLTDKVNNVKLVKWVYIGNIPLMTKRGHFILNGAARVIVNQILRSPGLYYQEKFYETYEEKWSQNPEESYKRYYVDLICMRGTWLRIEMDKEKNIWAQMKKGPKIPIFWFLLAMGLSEKTILKTITDSYKLLGNLENEEKNTRIKKRGTEPQKQKVVKGRSNGVASSFEELPLNSLSAEENKETSERSRKKKYAYLKNPPQAWKEIYSLISLKKNKHEKKDLDDDASRKSSAKTPGGTLKGIQEAQNKKNVKIDLEEEGRKWLYNKFMNPRSYDLGKQGRIAFNKKLGLDISTNQLTLTGLDVLYATDYLIKVEKGLKKIDDIDHLKNRRVRTSGELIQLQIGVGLVRLEKAIREALNKTSSNRISTLSYPTSKASAPYKSDFKTFKSTNLAYMKGKKEVITSFSSPLLLTKSAPITIAEVKETKDSESKRKREVGRRSGTKEKRASFSPTAKKGQKVIGNLNLTSLVNSKAFNSAIREFFGTSPLSQFMDQINPLAEITHKRRLSSMGPGGVTRDNATLAIRGIHPTHYGRICPIETPEGKNTGLVNSMTTYARVNSNGIIESPFYKVYKGQVQKNAGMYYFSAEQEEKIKIASADVATNTIGFLPKALVPARITGDFTKISRLQTQYIGASPLQMISIATSLIPFLEHDDANRALMGSNMQRQAVPLIRPGRPIVGTGLEARTISDSGHVLLSKYSGLVTYVSADKIVVCTFKK
uniref:DNA-directed RNA polymerase n=1 Tax=Chlorosarcinopsis eremi TaxID=332213 RepID=A0A5C2FSW9_9CHLO|nr:RNA polymerase beta subunit protein a [Chlorosarcinopsis eremi]AYQ94492.1 RNA polymerase beta subunit protein a [Chlorosarcinopsis eremi]QEP09235.1 RNA polymerase beta subunit protein a [Chlorosarcinopsis eremi]